MPVAVLTKAGNKAREKVKENKIMPAEIENYKQAWKKFQDKMAFLKKRKLEILANISKKFDQQKIEAIRKKLKNHA